MDFDPNISNWILEFLLKQPLNDGTLNSLVKTFPIPNDNLFLKKSLLLKKLESDISHNYPLSIKTIKHLEQLEQIEYDRGITEVSQAMKIAYLQVAVEYTVKTLRNEDGGEGKFCDAVKNVWTGRVREMEKNLEKGGLGTEELFDWRLKMEAAVHDHGVRQRVLKRSKEVNAVEALRLYLEEEREGMGPSFLELVAHRMKVNGKLKELLGLGNANWFEPKESILQSAITNDNKEVPKDPPLRSRHVSRRHARKRSSGNPTGAKIADSDGLAGQPMPFSNLLPGPEFNSVHEGLKSSSLVLEEDNALARASTNHGLVQQNLVNPYPPVDCGGIVLDNGGNSSNVTRPGILERSNNARTYEWDESVENSSEESQGQGSGVKLPGPEGKPTNAPKVYEKGGPMKRRRVGRWSAEEEDTLRIGVKKHGEGHWKAILTEFREIFEGRRTEVDLKDKWRNMTRS